MLRVLRAWLILLSASVVGACGGGSGTSGQSSGNTPVSTNGRVAIVMIGGGVSGITNAWVTIDKVAFNEDENRAWSSSDPSWKVVNLSPAVSFDMASIEPTYILGTLDKGKLVPVGTYRQIRLFLKAHDADGTKPGGRKYFSQVLYEGGGQPIIAPIEIPNLASGIKLDAGVNVEAGETPSVLTVRMDAARNLVRFDGQKAGVATVDALMLRPRTYTSLQVAAVKLGGVDDEWPRSALMIVPMAPSSVCGNPNAPSSPCANDISVSWYSPYGGIEKNSGIYSYSFKPYSEKWGATSVPKGTATGIINPLSYTYLTDNLGRLIQDASGRLLFSNPTKYDVIITGSGMKTMVVQDVPVPFGFGEVGCSRSVLYPPRVNYPTPPSAANKQYQFIYGKIYPDFANPQRNYSLSTPIASPSGRASLAFKLSTGTQAGKYYEVYSGNSDPFTGRFTSGARPSVPDSVTSSDVLVTSYETLSRVCNAAIAEAEAAALDQVARATAENQLAPAADREINLRAAFTPIVPDYGAIGFGTFYTNASTQAVTLNDTDFAVASLTDATGGVSQSVDVTINGLSSVISGYGSAKRAYLVVSDVGGVVSTVDVSACSDECTQTVSLPAGTLANGNATAVYEFAVRYWNATNEETSRSVSETNGTMRWARAASFVNLRAGTVTPNPSVTIAVP